MLYIIRGVSGSGKSTLAKKLKTITMSHYEADMYFMKDGLYVFDASKLGRAHAWCQDNVENDLMYKMDVIVSNTFTTLKEMKPYFELAKKYESAVQVITCQSVFKNIHYVPEEVLKKQTDRFATDLTSLFDILK